MLVSTFCVIVLYSKTLHEFVVVQNLAMLVV